MPSATASPTSSGYARTGLLPRPPRRPVPWRPPTRHGRASSTRLNGVSAARRKRVKPPAVTTSRSRASPACAPSASPTSCASDAGVQTQRRGGVEDAADRVEVVLDAVAGERLDDQPRAVAAERLAHVARRADRVAHVVQAVEDATRS